MSNLGIGCLTYKLTKAEEKKVEAAVDKLEKLCQELVIPGMCAIQLSGNSRNYRTTYFRNQVTSKADPSVDLLVKLADLIWNHDVDPDWVVDLWERVDEMHRQHKG